MSIKLLLLLYWVLLHESNLIRKFNIEIIKGKKYLVLLYGKYMHDEM